MIANRPKHRDVAFGAVPREDPVPVRRGLGGRLALARRQSRPRLPRPTVTTSTGSPQRGHYFMRQRIGFALTARPKSVKSD